MYKKSPAFSGHDTCNWCKNKLVADAKSSNLTPSTSQQPSTSLSWGQKSVDTMIIDNSSNYYKVLFCSVLFMLEEELAFTKIPKLIKLQKDSGLKLSYNDKLNMKTAVEMKVILFEVILSRVWDYCSKSNFFSLSGDASEARETGKSKELVFLKILVNGYQGFVPVNFLMKCQRLRHFGGGEGGGSAIGMLEAMLGMVECYLPREDFLSKLVCLVADGTSINFGEISGALTTIAELVEWDVPRIHCLNHRLELAMKDAYQGEQDFLKLKEMVDTLFRFFKHNGKTKTLY